MKKLAVIVGITAFLSGAWISRTCWLAATGALAAAPEIHRGAPVTEGEKYPYGGAQFSQFIADSYNPSAGEKAEEFYQWLEQAYERSDSRYPGEESRGLPQLIEWKKEELGEVSDPERKAQEETELGAWLHKTIKTVIPRFSLDRGFEFRCVVSSGERQCFLQSVLIAGLLQAMEVEAGVVMIYRNPEGKETNNGHAVVLLKLPNGRDILVDASELQPFACHQGLFVRFSGYQYVEPVYAQDPPVILSYKAASGEQPIEPPRVRPLDTRLLRSQFDYYRGERAIGGLLSPRPTPEGLETAARYLRASVESCPSNPLAVYTLGRVYLRQGKTGEARSLFEQACKLYSQSGWVPPGPKDFLARTHRR